MKDATKRADTPQSGEDAVEIGGNLSTEDYGKLYEICLKRFEKRGLSLKKGTRCIGIDLKTFYELEKAAVGTKFSLGRLALYKIKKFVLNGKRGGRKIKGVMQYPGKCVPFI